MWDQNKTISLWGPLRTTTNHDARWDGKVSSQMRLQQENILRMTIAVHLMTTNIQQYNLRMIQSYSEYHSNKDEIKASHNRLQLGVRGWIDQGWVPKKIVQVVGFFVFFSFSIVPFSEMENQKAIMLHSRSTQKGHLNCRMEFQQSTVL